MPSWLTTHAEVLAILVTLVAALWAGGRWTKRIEDSQAETTDAVTHLDAENAKAHSEIRGDLKDVVRTYNAQISDHGERIAAVEARVGGIRGR